MGPGKGEVVKYWVTPRECVIFVVVIDVGEACRKHNENEADLINSNNEHEPTTP